MINVYWGTEYLDDMLASFKAENVKTTFFVVGSWVDKYPESVKQLFESIPTLDVIVNNAGISYVGLLTDMSASEWHGVMSTNLDSLFYTRIWTLCKVYIQPRLAQCGY